MAPVEATGVCAKPVAGHATSDKPRNAARRRARHEVTRMGHVHAMTRRVEEQEDVEFTAYVRFEPIRSQPSSFASSASTTATFARSTDSISPSPPANASVCSGRTAPARRRRSRSARVCSSADSGDVELLGLRWDRDEKRASPATRHSTSGNAARRQADGRRDGSPVSQLLLAGPNASTTSSVSSSSTKSATRGVGKLSGGQKQRARARLRDRRRSRSALSRRADHRPRSAVAPAALGSDHRIQGARPHDHAHDALHGRSRDSLRPRRDRRSRQSDRARHAAGADRIARRRARRGVRAGATAGTALDDATLRALDGVRAVRRVAGGYELQVGALHRTVPALLALLASAISSSAHSTTHSATLEDVFVSLTGRQLRDE